MARYRRYLIILASALLLIPAGVSHASLTSTNFSINRDAISGGGLDASSALFKNASTAGQSSPLGASSSAGFNNYPGFWHALVSGSTVTHADTYAVTPSAGAGGSISPGSTQTVNYNERTSFTLTPNTGYHIASVSGCGGLLSGQTYTTGQITGDCTVSASFAINTFIVTPSSGSNGAISPNTAQTVNYGATMSFTITPNAGYAIASITGCGGTLSGNTYMTGPVTGNCTVLASFAAVTPPAFSSTSPASGSFVNKAAAGYTLSKNVTSGSITFIRTGGAADPALHVYTFTASDMTAGTHSVNTGLVLVNGAVYAVSFNATDGAGNAAATVSNTNITYDTTSASVTINSPASNSIVNTAAVGYTLSEDVSTGTIVFTRTGGAADGSSPHTYTMAGTDITAGSHTINTKLPLVSGSVYSLGIENVADAAGNLTATISPNTSITYDATAVAITNTTPVANSVISDSSVGYTLSEQALSGKVTFTRTGGAADNSSPHVYTFKASDLTAGAHTVDTGLVLADGAIYTVSFDAIDLAGNVATTVSNGSITYKTNVPADGDLTGDGTVDAADALKALRIAAGIDTATAADLSRGDVAPLVSGTPHPDGKIDIGDVVVILRKAVGLVSW